MTRASLFVSGIGYYELSVNGRKVGDHRLDVGWTDYSRRVYYSSFDLAPYLREGTGNAIAVTLGTGWYACASANGEATTQPGCVNAQPQLLLQANIECSDGATIAVTSGTNTWKSSPGPVVYDSLYNGETYDARRETPGWDLPGFDDSTWAAAAKATAASANKALLASQTFEPIRENQVLTPLTIDMPKPGLYVVDFGQNAAGVLRLRNLRGAAGTNVTLRHAELKMHPPYGAEDGTLYYGNLRSARATDVYVFKGDPDGESFEPMFTQHGFRYAAIEGLGYAPRVDDLEFVVLHSALPQRGAVTFSSPLLNKLQRMVVWGQTSNLMSVPTDCDQRNERRGWMGDAALAVEINMYNFGTAAFHSAWLNQIEDDQVAPGSAQAGGVTDFVPAVGQYGAGAPNWETAYPSIVHALWQYHGDVRVVQQHWPSLLRYMAFWRGKHANDGGLAKCCVGFGDWVPPPQPPGAGIQKGKKADGNLVGAFALLRDITLMRDLAGALGNATAAAAYDAQFEKWAAEFNSVWYDASAKSYSKNGASAMQTETALPLWLRIVPEADTDAVLAAYVHDIMVTHAAHTTAGIVGWKFGMEALTMYGRTDVGLAVALQDTYPSFGYMAQGKGNPEPATTVWELWDAPFEGPAMNSRNHIMFGTIGSWFFKALAGISPQTCGLGGTARAGGAHTGGARCAAVGAPAPAGYDAVSVYPAGVGLSPELTAVSADTWTPHGAVAVAWSTDATTGALALDVAVPVGTEAEVAVPFYRATAANVTVTEGGAPVWQGGKFVGAKVAGIRSGSAAADAIVLIVGSGSYRFAASA